jgi:NAD(P)-dependent dehydrogenase (short-subunit alcohol dehydrogenase family)
MNDDHNVDERMITTTTTTTTTMETSDFVHNDTAAGQKDSAPAATAAATSSSTSVPHNNIFVPQLATHGITFRELQIAVRVLNAVASLAAPSKNSTNHNDKKKKDSTSSSKKRSRSTTTSATIEGDGDDGADATTTSDNDDRKNKANDDNDNNNNNNDSGKKDNDDDDNNVEGLIAYKDKNLRPFRKALAGCIVLHQQTMYDGMGTVNNYLHRRDEVRTIKRQKMAEQDQQRKYLANTTLRRGRIERLKEKQNEGQNEEVSKQLSYVHELMIPDGHVETTAATTTTSKTALYIESGDEINVTNGNRIAIPPHQKEEENEEEGDNEDGIKLPKLRSCYVCKARFRDLHHFYDQLCPECATLNWTKRHQTTNLTGKVAVVTGSRVKIGYQTCLKLLRAGATVIATTRFPNAAVDSYRQESDFVLWRDRLQVYGLDLRDVTGIEAFCRFLKMKLATVGLDILINNACQTIRRPVAYYLPACEREEQLWKEADDTHRTILSGCLEFERIRRQLLLEHKEEQRQHHHHHHQGLTSSNGRDKVPALPGHTSSGLTMTDESTERTTHEASNAVCSDEQEETLSMTTEIATRRVAQNTTSGIVPFESTGMSHSAAASQMILLPEDVGVSDSVLPKGVTDINGQPLDLRTSNSWLLKMEEVSTPEVMECMFINAIAPFVLNSRLKPLMCMPPTHGGRYVVNVSAMEGKFYRYKMPTHPHTNMAKASLNMMTRTASEDLAKNHSIYMNSIDTGWINDENPLERASKTAEVNNFQTPIDEIDAAARIVDPIFSHSREYGKFLKDYRETEW